MYTHSIVLGAYAAIACASTAAHADPASSSAGGALLARSALVASEEPARPGPAARAVPASSELAPESTASPESAVDTGAAAPVPAVPPAKKLSPRNEPIFASYTANHDGEVTARDFKVKAGAPVLRGDGYAVALIAGYGVTHLELPMVARDRELTLHRFEGMLAGGGGIAPDWSLRGSLSGAYSSDLSDAAWDAFQVTAAVHAQRVLGPSDALIGGMLYSSTSDLFPVLPVVGYVHQRDGSPFRLDLFLPRHARAEYQLTPGLRGALGAEIGGSNWLVRSAQSDVHVRRFGGVGFGELEVRVSPLVRFQLRLGVALSRYTLPAQMPGTTYDQSLRAGGYGQLAIVVAP